MLITGGQFSCSVMTLCDPMNTTPYPLNQWCHQTILSFVAPFSSCPQSFTSSGSFLMSWLSASGGQSIGDSASASVLPLNIQGWFPLGLTCLISLLFKELSTSSWEQHHSLKVSILQGSAFFMIQLSYPYMTTGKIIVLNIWTFVSKVLSLLIHCLDFS